MGYFPNGTAGHCFEAQWCEECLNYRDKDDGRGPGCAVLDVHLVYNYDQHREGGEKLKDAMRMLIDDECAMFLDDGKDHKTLPLFPEEPA